MSRGSLCFVSYRDPGHPGARATIEAFVDTLKEMISAWQPDPEVYFAPSELRAGAKFEREIPAAICRSATFLMFYSPAYFDPAHSYCGREYMAMLRIEKERKRKFDRDDLILPVAYRGRERIPQEISESRHCVSLETVSLSADFMTRPVRDTLEQLAQGIWTRYDSLTRAGWDPTDCSGFLLPTHEEVVPQLARLNAPPPFPGR